MRLFSPAKVNLFLQVLKKRPDGYHEIETLFERISLGDDIFLKKEKNTIRLQCSDKKIPRGPKNLAYAAALLLKKRYSVPQGVSIRIQKRIPVGAGLGGGSSNAATVLLGLNRLWNLALSKKELALLGAELGSDVPFFIWETPFATGKGRGEIIEPLFIKKLKIWHCVIKPAFQISTREAYSQLGLSGLTPQKADAKMLLHSIRRGDSGKLSKRLVNSLEVALNNRVTEILEIKKELAKQGALGSLLSGSGSCVFGIFVDKTSAERAAKVLRLNNKWKVFVAATF